MIVNVVFNGVASRSLIESYGGVVVDDLPSLPSFMIIEIDGPNFLKLKKDPAIKMISEEEKLTVTFDYDLNYVPEAPNAGWNFNILKVKEYWDRGLTGKGVKVAIIDSGVGKHYSVPVTGGFLASGDDWYYDTNGHGTGVAGLLVGRPRVFNNQLYAGVAPEVDFYSILYNGGGVETTDTLYIKIVNFILQNKIDIVSMSIGIGLNAGTSPASLAFDEMLNAGVILCISAGNSNEDIGVVTGNYPNNDPRAIAVAGLSSNMTRWTSSSYGNSVKFIAPREKALTYSASANNYNWQHGVREMGGTSAAAPLVAGVFALYKQAYPDKTREELIDIVADSCLKIGNGDVWTKQTGYGLPQPSPEIMAMPKIIRGKGLRFNGTGQYIDCGNGPSLKLANNLTIITKFNQDIRGNGHLFAYSNPNGTKVYYGIKAGPDKLVIQTVEGETQRNFDYEMSLGDGRDHTLAIVYDQPQVRLYLDGDLLPKIITIPKVSVPNDNTAKGYIGVSRGLFGSFGGVISETKVYNRSLSENEILKDYNGSVSGEGLQLHYVFTGKEDEVVKDLSGNGNDGIIYGPRPNLARTKANGFNKKAVPIGVIEDITHVATDHSIKIDWKAIPNFKYELYLKGRSDTLVTTTTNSYTMTNLPSNTAFEVEIVGVNRLGNRTVRFSTGPMKTLIDTTAPAAVVPGSVYPSANEILIEWAASSSQDVTSFGYYELYMREKDSDPMLLVGTTKNLYYEFTDLKPNTDYSFWVVAVDNSGLSYNKSTPVRINGKTTNYVLRSVFEDDFNRPDSTTLGESYTLASPDNVYGVKDGMAYPVTAATWKTPAYTTVSTPSSSYIAEIEMSKLEPNMPLLAFNYVDDGNFYFIYYYPFFETYALLKAKGGGQVLWGTSDQITLVTQYTMLDMKDKSKDGDVIRVEVKESGVIKAYVNGHLGATVRDREYLGTTTKVGFAINNTAPGTLSRFDNFKIWSWDPA